MADVRFGNNDVTIVDESGNVAAVSTANRLKTEDKKLSGTTTTSINISTSTTVATLHALNTNRVKAVVWNNSTTGILYVNEGAGATATNHTYQLSPASATSPGGNCIIDDYSGIVTGILSTGTGTATGGETV